MPHAQVMIAAGVWIDKSGTDLASDSISVTAAAGDRCTISPRDSQASCASAKGHAKLSLEKNKTVMWLHRI